MPTDTSLQFSPSGAYDIGTPNNRVGNVYSSAPTVTQATSISTGVTINGTQGVITMFAGTILALANATFAVTNSSVTANSAINADVAGFAGVTNTNGVPYAFATGVAAGTFNVVVCNLHATQATGANSIKIYFNVIG